MLSSSASDESDEEERVALLTRAIEAELQAMRASYGEDDPIAQEVLPNHSAPPPLPIMQTLSSPPHPPTRSPPHCSLPQVVRLYESKLREMLRLDAATVDALQPTPPDSDDEEPLDEAAASDEEAPEDEEESPADDLLSPGFLLSEPA